MRVITLLLLLASSTSTLPAQDLLGPWTSMMQENDLVVRTDRHYTQGLKFTFLSGEAKADADSWFARWSGCLPDLGANFQAARYGVSVGQNIYTPTNITATALQLDDRPYAGFLYTALLLQRRGETAGGHPVLDHWQMDLGIVGPHALGEQAQNTVHRLRNFGLANGWANQVKDEPGVGLKYQRTWLCAAGKADGFAGQFLPHAGVRLGTSGTFAATGGQVRGGWRLPRDFGKQTADSILPGSGGLPQSGWPGWGTNVFIGLESRAVLYNPFLDGGLFHDSHRVAKHPLVGDVTFGWVVSFKHTELSYTQVIRSKEFVGQRETDAFGSLALTVQW